MSRKFRPEMNHLLTTELKEYFETLNPTEEQLLVFTTLYNRYVSADKEKEGIRRDRERWNRAYEAQIKAAISLLKDNCLEFLKDPPRD